MARTETTATEPMTTMSLAAQSATGQSAKGPSTIEVPMTVLRGASVDVDAARVARALVVVCILALVGVAAGLFVAGAQKNSQIDALRNHGVPVQITVTDCLGLLGGSGTNAAGYACTGTYSIGGRRYVKAIPGTVNRAIGSKVAAVSSASDPGLVSTVSDVDRERSSLNVYVVPSLLLVAAALAAGAVVVVRRRKRSEEPS